MNRATSEIRRATGFTYLVMLFAVAITGVMLAAVGVVWHDDARRARENELLRIGGEFRRAVGLYYERTPGGVKRFPEKLEDLLRDHRYLSIQRYLRRIYHDPLTGQPTWGLVRAADGTIMGVHSLSRAAPRKSSGFAAEDSGFSAAKSYADWRFVYVPPLPVLGLPATAADRTGPSLLRPPTARSR